MFDQQASRDRSKSKLRRGGFANSKMMAIALCFSTAIVATAIAMPPAPALAQTGAIASRMVELRASNRRWIEIDLSRQRLIAWEGDAPTYAVIVSTGTSSHPTLPGSFVVQSMHRTARMRGAGYDVPNVPYVMYYDDSYGIHGTYWHNQFGTPMSHGCVNVAVDHAEWLFNWANIGTPVIVHD